MQTVLPIVRNILIQVSVTLHMETANLRKKI